MRDWSAEVDSLFGELNRSIRGVAKRVRSALGDSPLEVLGYRGYGNARTALVHGRVVARRGVGPSSGRSCFRQRRPAAPCRVWERFSFHPPARASV